MSFTTTDKGRPGVWINFEAAAVQATEGSDGTVVIVKENYNVTADADTIYEFEKVSEAQAVVGVTKMADIERAFKGGAAKVIIYTKVVVDDYTKAQAALELQLFEALSFDHALLPADVLSWKAWLNTQGGEENYRELFYGVEVDTDVTAGIARSTTDNNELISNVINAPKYGEEELTSAEIAPWAAGLYAATPLTSSMTFAEVPDATDVNVRLSSAQTKAALAAGAIVFEYNGRNVRLVRGVATDGTSLRRVSIKQALARDWKYLIETKYIGKAQNGVNERLAMRGELDDYLSAWEARGIIEADTWHVNVTEGATKQQVLVHAYLRDLETMEEIYITVGLGA